MVFLSKEEQPQQLQNKHLKLRRISTLKMVILSLKLKCMLAVEEKVHLSSYEGHLTSGLKGGVQILKTPE